MKTRKAINVALATGLIVLGLGLFKEAIAANPDTMRMTVSVDDDSVGYAVSITSPEVQGYDFGAVDIAQVTISTLPILVTNGGTLLEYFSVAVNDVTPTYAWTNNGASLTVGATSYVMQARFVATTAGQPAESAFDGAAHNASGTYPPTASGRFGQAAGLAGKTSAGAAKHLWLRLHMPNSVEETDPHTLVLTINGQGT
jgi:hypothetical protein